MAIASNKTRLSIVSFREKWVGFFDINHPRQRRFVRLQNEWMAKADFSMEIPPVAKTIRLRLVKEIDFDITTNAEWISWDKNLSTDSWER